MNSVKKFLDIGPFDGVPEERRALAARQVCEAVEKSLAACIRQAKAREDGCLETDAYFPCMQSINDCWKDVRSSSESEVRYAASSARCGILPISMGAFFASIGSWGLWASTKPDFPSATLLMGGLFAAIGLILVSCGLYVTGRDLRDYLRLSRELRCNGYCDGALEKRLSRSAATVWLVGRKAIHMSERLEHASPRSVFFDALGYVNVEQIAGHRYVVLYNREGSTVACLAAGDGVSEDLAERLNARLNASRQAD